MPDAVQDAVHYAYFAPYTLDDHMALVSELQSDDRVRLQVLGETLDGHDIDMLQIGEDASHILDSTTPRRILMPVPMHDSSRAQVTNSLRSQAPISRQYVQFAVLSAQTLKSASLSGLGLQH